MSRAEEEAGLPPRVARATPQGLGELTNGAGGGKKESCQDGGERERVAWERGPEVAYVQSQELHGQKGGAKDWCHLKGKEQGSGRGAAGWRPSTGVSVAKWEALGVCAEPFFAEEGCLQLYEKAHSRQVLKMLSLDGDFRAFVWEFEAIWSKLVKSQELHGQKGGAKDWCHLKGKEQEFGRGAARWRPSTGVSVAK
ncbi:hypothetical protein GOP47_0026448 [Adiantum capillus-veneris]|nr:hypothetical protein GOP47_0026448 [Adiantum capillus-veneris]